MEHQYIAILSALKGITVLLGAIFLWYAGRAWWRHRSKAMAWLFVAIALLTAAAVAEGTALQIVGLPLDQAHVVEAVFTLAGFAVLVGSILAHKFG